AYARRSSRTLTAAGESASSTSAEPSTLPWSTETLLTAYLIGRSRIKQNRHSPATSPVKLLARREAGRVRRATEYSDVDTCRRTGLERLEPGQPRPQGVLPDPRGRRGRLDAAHPRRMLPPPPHLPPRRRVGHDPRAPLSDHRASRAAGLHP